MEHKLVHQQGHRKMEHHKHQFIILKNEDPYDHQLWVDACKEFSNKIDYRVVDLTSGDWLEEILAFPCDMLLVKPGGKTKAYKQLYDERLNILVQELNYACFPSLKEVLIYENKRYQAYWLKANQIPHPATRVFYSRKEAIRFIEETRFPLVAKLNIGASGNGVEILHTRKEAKEYINLLFSKGIAPRTGPKFNKGNFFNRGWDKMRNPGEMINRLKTYRNITSDVQKYFVIFQEYIQHGYEWRVVRIGNSFFAHKKILRGEKASGSLVKGYENPPLGLLDFVKKLTDRFGFYSQAVDVFESQQNDYLVNEMQCIFGQSDPYQMLVDNKPGRYIFDKERWIFEEGDFNRNESYNLRLQWLIKQLTHSSS